MNLEIWAGGQMLWRRPLDATGKVIMYTGDFPLLDFIRNGGTDVTFRVTDPIYYGKD